uniref:Uncharacterized protein n=1 Tax=Ascaris lumbricoides TaxID=6252 RepID=A0A0M3IX66_ASCLU
MAFSHNFFAHLTTHSSTYRRLHAHQLISTFATRQRRRLWKCFSCGQRSV